MKWILEINKSEWLYTIIRWRKKWQKPENEELDLIQNSNSNELQSLIDEALSKFPDKIIEYKNGKIGLLGLFVGEVMKLSKGKADPKLLNQLVKQTLEK